MKRTGTYGTLMLLALALLPSAHAEPTTEESAVVAGMGIFIIYCSSEAHPIVPLGSPDPANPLPWVFSGEPECAAGDADNRLREASGQDRVGHGYGGAGHEYGIEDVGTTAIASFDDAVFGAGAGYLRLFATGQPEGRPETATSEGCGPQMITLPQDDGHHQPWPMPPTLWWTYVDAVGVQDDLTVCFATTGTLHATWGA